MKVISNLLRVVLLVVLSCCITVAQAYTPAEFAYTATIELPASEQPQPFYQLILPLEIYRNSVQPALADLTVFNQAGQIMPHALIEKRQHKIEQFSLTRFALSVPESVTEGGQIKIESVNGLSITLPQSSIAQAQAQAYKNIWLLSLPADITATATGAVSHLQQLQLQWQTEQRSWQAKASVLISEDLQHWQSLANQFNIMELYANNDKLQVNQIPLKSWSASNGETKPYYLLLMVESSQDDLPQLLDVIAQIKTFQPPVMVSIPFDNKILSDNEVEYRLPFAKYLSALEIQPQQPQSVLPIEVSLRSAPDAYWREYPAMILYNMAARQVDEQANRLNLSSQLVQGVMIKSNLNLNTPYTPQVSGQRPMLTLIFNTQGQGPYTLAWGNKDKSQSAMAIEQLIPANLLADSDYFSLPAATLSDNIATNVAVLKQLNQDNQSPTDYTLWIWIGLLLAVVLLVLFTLRIVKEMKKGAAYGDR